MPRPDGVQCPARRAGRRAARPGAGGAAGNSLWRARHVPECRDRGRGLSGTGRGWSGWRDVPDVYAANRHLPHPRLALRLRAA